MLECCEMEGILSSLTRARFLRSTSDRVLTQVETDALA